MDSRLQKLTYHLRNAKERIDRVDLIAFGEVPKVLDQIAVDILQADAIAREMEAGHE